MCDKNNVYVLSSNYQLYGNMSERVMEGLKLLAPVVELYSVDEAFLRLDSLSWMNLEEYGVLLKDKIKMWTGIPISVGIAHTKTLAKIANHLAKKSTGVVDLRIPKLIEEVLSKLEVKEIWGIGKNLTASLNKLGIYTAKQLKDANPKLIRQRFGMVGEKVVQELNGISCYDLATIPQSRKNIISSRSFGKHVTNIEELKEAVAAYVTIASEKMRKQKSRAQGICVYIMTSRFQIQAQYYANSKIYRFIMPTSDTRFVINKAHQCLKEIYKSGYRYSKAGIMLMDLIDEEYKQVGMFESENYAKSDALMAVIDRINKQSGKGSVFFASVGTKPNWRMKNYLRSPRYTTSWEELLLVY
jgi:DNA polymerase V